MVYLLPTEYVQYGLATDTTDDWITMASALMDSYCRRVSLMATQYVERMRLTSGASAVRPSYAIDTVPLTLLGVRVRYGRPRRGDFANPLHEEIAGFFGLPNGWSALDIQTVDVNGATGELTFPANFLGLSYNEVEITYTAGLIEIPPAVKVACAQIVKNAQAMPASNVRSTKIDTLQMEYVSGDHLIDDQVRRLLRPYLAQRVG